MAETQEYVWKEDVAVPAHLITYIDDAVKNALPGGTQFEGISPSGASYWARTAKIHAFDQEGNETPFFIKVHQYDNGKAMVSSEYEAMRVLHAAWSQLVPEPMAWGTYESEEQVYFFVSRFVELSGDIPDVSDLPALLADMHKRPESRSPTGQFGFHLTTIAGRNPQKFPLSDTWEEALTKCLEITFDAEEVTQGFDEELKALRQKLFSKVIPRLMKPLETGGRKLEPTLCHGNLWDGNTSIDAATGEPKVFDATPVYAHNEYELAPWFVPRHRMTDRYIKAYISHYEPTHPAEDFNDRGILYSLRFDVHASSLYPGNLRFRKVAMKNMRYLTEKYPGGYEGYVEEHEAGL